MNNNEITKKIIDRALEISKGNTSTPEKDLLEYVMYLIKSMSLNEEEQNDI